MGKIDDKGVLRLAGEALEIESAMSLIEDALENRFNDLQQIRELGGEDYGVFVLEHGLSAPDIELLVRLYRDHLNLEGNPQKFPLCACVYFAEIGFVYTANSDGEYWPMVEENTPRPIVGRYRQDWHDGNSHARNMVRELFKEFAQQYGGVEPQGRFAESSGIIAWPITHAVLSKDLRMHLATALHYCVDYWFTGTTSDDAARDIHEFAESRFGTRHRFTQFANQIDVVAQIIGSLLTFDDSSDSDDDIANRYISPEVIRRIFDDMHKTTTSRNEISHARNRFKTNVGGFGKRLGVDFRTFDESGPDTKVSKSRSRTASVPSACVQAEFDALTRSWKIQYLVPGLRQIGERNARLATKLRASQLGVVGSDDVFLNSISRSNLKFTINKKIANFRAGVPKLTSPAGLTDEDLREISIRCRDHEFDAAAPWLFRLSESEDSGRLTKSYSASSKYLLLVDSNAVISINELRPIALAVDTSISDGSVAAFHFELTQTNIALFDNVLQRMGFAQSLQVDIAPAVVPPQFSDDEGGAWQEGETVTLQVEGRISGVRAKISIQDQEIEQTLTNEPFVISLEALPLGQHIVVFNFEFDGRTTVGEYEIRVIPRNTAKSQLVEFPIKISPSSIDISLDSLIAGTESIWIDGPLRDEAKIYLELENYFSQSNTRLELKPETGAFTFPVSGADLNAALIRCAAEAPGFRKQYDTATNARFVVSNEKLQLSDYVFDLHMVNRKIILDCDVNNFVTIQTTDELKSEVKVFSIFDWILPLTAYELKRESDLVWKLLRPEKAHLIYAVAGEEMSTYLHLPSTMKNLPVGDMKASLALDSEGFETRVNSLRAIIIESEKNSSLDSRIRGIASRLLRESITESTQMGIGYQVKDALSDWMDADFIWSEFEEGMRVFRVTNPIEQVTDREFAMHFTDFLHGKSAKAWLGNPGIGEWMYSNRETLFRTIQRAKTEKN